MCIRDSLYALTDTIRGMIWDVIWNMIWNMIWVLTWLFFTFYLVGLEFDVFDMMLRREQRWLIGAGFPT